MSLFARLFQPAYRAAAATFTTAPPPRTPLILRQSTFRRPIQTSTRWRPSLPKRPFHTSPSHRAYRRQAFNYQNFRTAQSLFSRWAARPTFYRDVGVITAGTGGVYVYNLEAVPVSGRRRFRIIPYSVEAWQGAQMYAQVMQEYQGKLMSPSSKEHKMVERVMERLVPHSGLEGEEWEVHVINDPMKNAFVIPGGKVFVFRGILDVAQGEDGLAAVLGHEIAHNVAHHAAERMSQSLPVFLLIGVLQAIGIDAGIGSTLLNLAFTLPGSRKQEEEADYIGLMMMSESCYDPKAAMGLWGRMEQEEKGAPPQFLSTHPSSHNRLEKIQGWLPRAEEKAEGSGCGRIGGYGEWDPPAPMRRQLANREQASDFREQMGLLKG
ncbi:hypothetical protein LTR62_002914 [Meristemomyces frigidus]|uniref:Peptidase M48 domain-containing protein n=1 Tax=Meristemomyces frigidus TaxID=1508187 RepID=A0AAN7YUE2_9PEZI|nr:hypothetical protein LTR62_002914 [Meristemomyces frigidus]